MSASRYSRYVAPYLEDDKENDQEAIASKQPVLQGRRYSITTSQAERYYKDTTSINSTPVSASSSWDTSGFNPQYKPDILTSQQQYKKDEAASRYLREATMGNRPIHVHTERTTIVTGEAQTPTNRTPGVSGSLSPSREMTEVRHPGKPVTASKSQTAATTPFDETSDVSETRSVVTPVSHKLADVPSPKSFSAASKHATWPPVQTSGITSQVFCYDGRTASPQGNSGNNVTANTFDTSKPFSSSWFLITITIVFFLCAHETLPRLFYRGSPSTDVQVFYRAVNFTIPSSKLQYNSRPIVEIIEPLITKHGVIFFNLHNKSEELDQIHETRLAREVCLLADNGYSNLMRNMTDVFESGHRVDRAIQFAASLESKYRSEQETQRIVQISKAQPITAFDSDILSARNDTLSLTLDALSSSVEKVKNVKTAFEKWGDISTSEIHKAYDKLEEDIRKAHQTRIIFLEWLPQQILTSKQAMRQSLLQHSMTQASRTARGQIVTQLARADNQAKLLIESLVEAITLGEKASKSVQHAMEYSLRADAIELMLESMVKEGLEKAYEYAHKISGAGWADEGKLRTLRCEFTM